jgi:hypothetical protein
VLLRKSAKIARPSGLDAGLARIIECLGVGRINYLPPMTVAETFTWQQYEVESVASMDLCCLWKTFQQGQNQLVREHYPMAACKGELS